MKKRIFEIIQIGSREDLPSRLFDYIIILNIAVNISAMFLETFESLSEFMPFFNAAEAVTVFFFCVEYGLRIWTADLLFPDESRPKAVLKFLFSFDGIIDLLTILPMFWLSGFVAFRLLRVVRILHLFRLNAQYDSFNVIWAVIVEKKNQLASSMFIIIVLMFASSLGIYSAEHEAQPEVFSNAFSGIWWSVSTLLTVGYGDIYPVTVVGRLIAICIAFLGVCAVAIPTGIISAGFVERYSRDQHSDSFFNDTDTVGEILVTEESELCGLTVREIAEDYSVNIIVILRGKLTVIAAGDITVECGDILVAESKRLIKKAVSDQ